MIKIMSWEAFTREYYMKKNGFFFYLMDSCISTQTKQNPKNISNLSDIINFILRNKSGATCQR